MKILFLGQNLTQKKDLSIEGLVTIVQKLENHFNKKHTIFINNTKKLKESNIINLHSSGFSEILNYKKKINKIIYCIHSDIKSYFFHLLKDIFQFYKYIWDKNKDHLKLSIRIKRSLLSLISQLIPIFIKRFFLKKSKLVIAPNKYTFKLLKLKNSIIIRQGININKFKNLKLKSNKINVSYIGHPSPSKGLLEIINAFSKLKKYEKNLFLSYTNKKIKRFIKHKNNNIQIYGFRKNIIKDYNNSDIIVLPYRHSLGTIANPLVLLEAMACERAIITTNLPHIKEICGNSVIYVKPYSPKQIVKAINYLAKNPKLRKELGKKARQRVVKYYNEEDMFKKYGEVYKKYKK